MAIRRTTFNIKVVLWILILILSIKLTDAQDIYYKVYNTSNGIPSTQVYDIKIDHQGYLWYATDFGVGRFDGFEFQNYTIEDGLPNNSIIRLYVDQKGRMWFHGYSGELSYFDNEEIVAFPYNEQLSNFTYNNYVHEIYIDEAGNLIISPMSGGVSKFDCDGSADHMDLMVQPLKYCYFLINDFGDEVFTSLLADRNARVIVDSLRTVNQYRVPFKYKKLAFHRYCIKLDEHHFILSYGNELCLLKNGAIIRRLHFKDQIAGIMLDAEHNLWVTLMFGQGVHMYAGADLEIKPIKYFEGKTITKVMQDREGNYWFSTVGEGLLFAPSINYIIFNETKDGHALNILSMDRFKDDLYVSTIDKSIYKYNISHGRATEKDLFIASDLSNWVFDIEVDVDGQIWLASAYDMRMDSLGKPLPPDSSFTTYEIEEGRNGRILLGSNMLSVYENNQLSSYPSDQFRRRIYALHEDETGNIWIGTLAGLYKFNGQDYIFMGAHQQELGKRINCISSIGDCLIIGSGSYGVILYQGDSIQKIINKENGLVSNSVNELYFDEDSTLWVGTNRGLSKIRFMDLDSLHFNIENYTSLDGLPAEHINEILALDQYLWLGTDQGLICFNPDKVKVTKKAPPIDITGISINARDTLLVDEYNLESYQNNIRIYFKSVSFKGRDNIVYRYLMINLNEEVILTNNTYADFPNLPSGEYTFLVNAGYKDGLWNETPQSLKITINKHFTETAWFIILIILAGFMVIGYIVMKILQNQKIKEERKKELIKLENRFFRSQLNPHFIFNALLAIQSFIFKKRPDEAVRYLTNFAKLIRYILSISDEELISLDKEIQFIQNYLELQKLRFSEKFNYSIVVDPEINVEMVNIPPLLAQPFIENAIEHGIQYKPTKGNLEIILSAYDHSILFEVIDDGIGREASARINAKRTDKPKSYGMAIIQQRIDLMNKITDYDIQVEIDDLFEGNEASGTRVSIRIPI